MYEARTRYSDLTVHHRESVVRDDVVSEITGVRIRRRNVSDALVVKGSIEEVTKCEKKMEEAFEKFKMAWDSYRNLLVEDDDLEECAAYF